MDGLDRLLKLSAQIWSACKMCRVHLGTGYIRAGRLDEEVFHVPGPLAHNLRPRLPFILDFFVGVRS